MSTDALTEHESDHARGQCGCPCLWECLEQREQVAAIARHREQADAEVARLREALETVLGDRVSPDDPHGDDTDQLWWNHPEWSDDEMLLVGVTVGQMREWSLLATRPPTPSPEQGA